MQRREMLKTRRIQQNDSLKNIQEKMKQLTNYSEKYGDWIRSMHQDIVVLKETFQELKLLQQENCHCCRRCVGVEPGSSRTVVDRDTG